MLKIFDWHLFQTSFLRWIQIWHPFDVKIKSLGRFLCFLAVFATLCSAQWLNTCIEITDAQWQSNQVSGNLLILNVIFTWVWFCSVFDKWHVKFLGIWYWVFFTKKQKEAKSAFQSLKIVCTLTISSIINEQSFHWIIWAHWTCVAEIICKRSTQWDFLHPSTKFDFFPISLRQWPLFLQSKNLLANRLLILHAKDQNWWFCAKVCLLNFGS